MSNYPGDANSKHHLQRIPRPGSPVMSALPRVAGAQSLQGSYLQKMPTDLNGISSPESIQVALDELELPVCTAFPDRDQVEATDKKPTRSEKAATRPSSRSTGIERKSET